MSPIYEYRCEKCGGKVEILVAVGEDCGHECVCGGKLHKIISPCLGRMGEHVRHPNHPDMVEKANAERRERRKIKANIL